MEVAAQTRVIFLDDDPGGLLDRLGPDSTLRRNQTRIIRFSPQTIQQTTAMVAFVASDELQTFSSEKVKQAQNLTEICFLHLC